MQIFLPISAVYNNSIKTRSTGGALHASYIYFIPVSQVTVSETFGTPLRDQTKMSLRRSQQFSKEKTINSMKIKFFGIII